VDAIDAILDRWPNAPPPAKDPERVERAKLGGARRTRRRVLGPIGASAGTRRRPWPPGSAITCGAEESATLLD